MPATATLAAAAGFCLVMYAGQVTVLAPLTGSGAWLRAGNVGFSYPSEWGRVEAPVGSSFSWMVAAVSNQPLRRPCEKSAGSGATTIVCGTPVAQLEPGAVLVEWWQDGFPGFRFDAVPGSPGMIDGRPVRIVQEDQAAQECSSTGAGRTIRAVILRAAGNYFVFVACLGSRDRPEQSEAALQILHSAHFYEQWQTP